MIGNQIKELRLVLKLSQKDFGAFLGVSDSAISQIEKGKNSPSSQLATAICAIHNVNREWLETGKGPMFKGTAIGLERFSPAQRALVERFSRYLTEKVSISETEETVEMVHLLLNILVSGNETVKGAIKSSRLAFSQTVQDERGKIEEMRPPDPKPNPRSHTKKTKTG